MGEHERQMKTHICNKNQTIKKKQMEHATIKMRKNHGNTKGKQNN